MKKLVYAIFIVLLFVGFSTNLQADASGFREVKVVSGSSLIVKSSAASNASSLLTLKRGEFVTVLSTANDWSYIQANEVKGYVQSKYLTTPASTIKIASSKSGLVVKTSPSKSAKTSATLKYNMIVEDFGSVGGGWNFVQYGNVTGYVATTFIGTPKTVTKYISSAVKLRNIASPSGSIKETLESGVQVQVHSTIVGWSYVSVGNKRGYVQASLLTTKKPQTSSVAYIANYLPVCPSTYVYRLTSDYSKTQYNTYQCELTANGPYMIAEFNDDSGYKFLPNGDLYVTGAKMDFVYKKALRAGDRWTSDTFYNSERITYTVKSINETVVTPSGTYRNVLKIQQVAPSYDITIYFAPGYGEVKIESHDGGVSELYSVTK